jgi:hypothetical protein
MQPDLTLVYVCERCFSADDQPGPCRRCQQPRREFAVGALDDPQRRPLIGADGQLRCRAPLWWVSSHAPYVRQEPPS